MDRASGACAVVNRTFTVRINVCSRKWLLPGCCRLLSFIQWVETEHPEVNLTGHGCFNPYVGAVEAPLSALSQPKQIGGCVPQVPTEDSQQCSATSIDVVAKARRTAAATAPWVTQHAGPCQCC